MATPADIDPVLDPTRVAALRSTGLLDSAAEPAFDRFSRLAATLLDAPIALVSLVDADRQFFKSSVGLPEPWQSARGTPLSHSFCRHPVASREPLVIDDARNHALVRDNPAIAALGVVAYLGVPLIASDGNALGAFCVIDSAPRTWSARDLAVVQDLAAAVVTEIELRNQRAIARREAFTSSLAHKRLRVEHAVTEVLADAANFLEATGRLLEAIRKAYGWQWSAMWVVDESVDRLRFTSACTDLAAELTHFETLSRTTIFARGLGLPGRVWDERRPIWVEDVQEDENFARIGAARAAGLHGAFCFPLSAKGRVEAVLEFMSLQIEPPDPPLLAMLASIGRQVGQFLERKRAEEALRRNESRLAAIVATSLDCIVGMDHQGAVIDWNPAAEATFGYAREEAIGREMAELIIPPEMREQHRQGLARHLATGHDAVLGKRLELTAVRRDGTVFPVELAITRVPTDAMPTFTGYLRDISSRKAAEAEVVRSRILFQGIADTTPDILWLYDVREHRVVYSNRSIAAALGYSAEEVLGLGAQVLPRLIVPADLPHLMQVIAGFDDLADGDVREHEYRARHREGGMRWLASRSVVFTRTSDGRPQQVLTLTHDVTRRKDNETERDRLLASEQAARAEAERATRLKDEFLATVSHELRTPLSAILGYAHVLRRRRLDDDVAQGLEVIERNARVQTDIINDLLDMSRIMSGKLRLEVQAVDLTNVIAAAVETVRPAADAKAIRLVQTLDPHTGSVSGDPGRLQQVIWNLLTNAVKFTPKGGRVQIVLARVNSHIEIRVSDTGQGIAPDFLPYVFDKFRQSDASMARLHGGLGLGLSLVKNLVEMHGGSVRATSAGAGKGATFVVELPFTAVRADPHERRQQPQRAGGGAIRAEPPSLTGITVLAVDDEHDTRELLRRILEDRGARVITAGSALEALAALDSERVDLLLSDIGMPEIDGYELVRRVRTRPAERGGEVPAAALTAFARSEDRTTALMAGYQTHIAKPVEPVELAAAVASLVRRTPG
ncbi:MAG: PAS domain S-box protein [Casimicrobiaceae bacterium]